MEGDYDVSPLVRHFDSALFERPYLWLYVPRRAGASARGVLKTDDRRSADLESG